jgi:hypothetical protein
MFLSRPDRDWTYINNFDIPKEQEICRGKQTNVVEFIVRKQLGTYGSYRRFLLLKLSPTQYLWAVIAVS